MKDILISIRVADLKKVYLDSATPYLPREKSWKAFYQAVHEKAVVTADDGRQNADLQKVR